MAEKETKSCSDCIHFDVCYKIEHFGRDLEDTSPCKQFISKDVAPVRHGYWEGIEGESCSVCGKNAREHIVCEFYWYNSMPEFFPHYGSKMDGGEQK